MGDLLVIVGIALFSWWVESKKKKRKARKRATKATVNPSDYNKRLGRQHGKPMRRHKVSLKRKPTLNHQPTKAVRATQRAEEAPMSVESIESLGDVWSLLKQEYKNLNDGNAKANARKTGSQQSPWGKASAPHQENTTPDHTPRENLDIPAEIATPAPQKFPVMPTADSIQQELQRSHDEACVEPLTNHSSLTGPAPQSPISKPITIGVTTKSPSYIALHNRKFSPKAAYLQKELFDRPLATRQAGGKVWQ